MLRRNVYTPAKRYNELPCVRPWLRQWENILPKEELLQHEMRSIVFDSDVQVGLREAGTCASKLQRANSLRGSGGGSSERKLLQTCVRCRHGLVEGPRLKLRNITQGTASGMAEWILHARPAMHLVHLYADYKG